MEGHIVLALKVLFVFDYLLLEALVIFDLSQTVDTATCFFVSLLSTFIYLVIFNDPTLVSLYV